MAKPVTAWGASSPSPVQNVPLTPPGAVVRPKKPLALAKPPSTAGRTVNAMPTAKVKATAALVNNSIARSARDEIMGDVSRRPVAAKPVVKPPVKPVVKPVVKPPVQGTLTKTPVAAVAKPIPTAANTPNYGAIRGGSYGGVDLKQVSPKVATQVVRASMRPGGR